MNLQWNPFKYGDLFGLTKGPLSGDFPGKLTDTGLDLQGKINPLISRKDLEHSNNLAPWIAAAIATFGGSAAGEGGGLLSGGGQGGLLGGSSAPAWGSMDAGPGAYSMGGKAAGSKLSFLDYARLANMASGLGGQPGQYGQAPQHQFVGPEDQFTLLRRRYGSA